MNPPPDTINDALAALSAVDAPRRSDAAFVAAVKADLAQRSRSRWATWLLPAGAFAAAGAFALVLLPGAPQALDAGVAPTVALTVTPSLAATPSATAQNDGAQNDGAQESDPQPDDDDGFTLPTLDASSDEELLAFESRLDASIDAARKRRVPLQGTGI